MNTRKGMRMVFAGAAGLGLSAPMWIYAAAGAQQQVQPQTTQQQNSQQVEQRFTKLDSDGDGFIRMDEAQRSGVIQENEFAAADRNGDKRVSLAEYQLASHGKSGQQAQAQQQQGVASGQQAGGQAHITVKEAPPRVQVEKQAPKVIVKQPKPEVTVKQPEPQVTITQPKPEVRVQEAEPQVSVQDQGKPQVQIQKQQQARVQVERPQPQQQAQQANGILRLTASDLQGKTVYNAAGEKLGEIEQVVQSKQDPQQLAGVIEIGGFLGIGGKKVDIPVDQMQLQNQRLVATVHADKDRAQAAAAIRAAAVPADPGSAAEPDPCSADGALEDGWRYVHGRVPEPGPGW